MAIKGSQREEARVLTARFSVMEGNVQSPLKFKIVFGGKPPQAPPSPRCTLCGRAFSSANALHGHMRSHRLPPPSIQMPSAHADPPPRPPPPPCGWSRTAKRSLMVPVERIPEVFDGEEKDAAEDEASSEISTNAGAVASEQEDVGTIEQYCGSTCESSETPAGDCDCGCCRRWRCRSSLPTAYACGPCGRAFASRQALCGHMASHRKLHNHAPKVDGSPLEWSYSKASKRRRVKGENPAEHRCEVCGRAFPTGQALGGHKRLHWEGPKSFPTTLILPPPAATPGDMESTSARVLHDFDLNEMPVVEDGAEGNLQQLLLLV